MAPCRHAAQTDAATVDNAFNTLKTYDWGADRAALNPIDQAIVASHGDAAARQALEKRLVDALAGGLSRSAQDYVCRKLRVVGTAQSVPALAALLPAEQTSHIARYALERIPDEKAVEALRDALPKVSNKLKPGLIGSLGKRRDTKSIEADREVSRRLRHPGRPGRGPSAGPDRHPGGGPGTEQVREESLCQYEDAGGRRPPDLCRAIGGRRSEVRGRSSCTKSSRAMTSPRTSRSPP